MLSLSLIFGSFAVVYLGIIFFVGVGVCVLWSPLNLRVGSLLSVLRNVQSFVPHVLSHQSVIFFPLKIPVNTYVRPFYSVSCVSFAQLFTYHLCFFLYLFV